MKCTTCWTNSGMSCRVSSADDSSVGVSCVAEVETPELSSPTDARVLLPLDWGALRSARPPAWVQVRMSFLVSGIAIYSWPVGFTSTDGIPRWHLGRVTTSCSCPPHSARTRPEAVLFFFFSIALCRQVENNSHKMDYDLLKFCSLLLPTWFYACVPSI